jgi:tetratricopeptide (TPR) repeat protein
MSEKEKNTERLKNHLHPIILPLAYVLIVTAIAFSPVLNNDFTNWDDQKHVYENPLIRSSDGLPLREIFTTSISKIYIPLTILSFSIEHRFFGFNPFVYHLTNLLLHLAVTALIFRFALRLQLTARAATLAALLFGIHPMHVESVAWITERKDVLYAFFYMLALDSYLTYLQRGKGSSYLLTILFGLLSLLAKPMTLSLPLILFVCDWLHHRKLTWRVLLEKIPYGAIMIPITLITYLQHVRVPGQNLAEAFLIWTWTSTFYIQKFLWPFVFVPLYQLPQPIALSNPSYALAFVILLLIILCIVRLRKNRWFVFALLYYFASAFFLWRYDNAVDVTIVADRFMYLPSLGICISLGILGDKMAGDFLKRKPTLVGNLIFVGLAVIMAGLALKTYFQTKIWKNSITLWSYVIQHSPALTIAHVNRGDAYTTIGEVELAEADYREAAEIKLERARRHCQRARDLHSRKEYDSALLHYNNALLHNPRSAQAYIGRGDIYQIRRQFEDALSEYNKAMDIRPDDSELYFVRGHVYSLTQSYDRAIADFTRALEINPRRAQAYYFRAVAYSQNNQGPLALQDFKRALEINPQYADVYFDRGNFYLKERQYALAIDDYTQALALQPQALKIYYNRAVVYRHLEKYALALADYNKVLEMDPKHVGAHLRKSEIYYRTNELDKAREGYTQTIHVNPLTAEAYLQRSKVCRDQGNFKGAFLDALVTRHLGGEIEEDYIEELKNLIKQANSPTAPDIRTRRSRRTTAERL